MPEDAWFPLVYTMVYFALVRIIRGQPMDEPPGMEVLIAVGGIILFIPVAGVARWLT